MTVSKKKPARNATKIESPRALWVELKSLSPADAQTLAETAMATSQIQSRFWDSWSDQHRGDNSEIILRQAYEARQRGEEVYDELQAMPDGLWSYLQSQCAEEFANVHRRVIDLLSNRFIKALNVKVPAMGNLQTWRCVLLGAVDRPYHVGLGIVPFDSANAKLYLEEDGETAKLVVRITRSAEPLAVRFRLGAQQKLANGTARLAPLLTMARACGATAKGKHPMRGGWLYRSKFGRWCVAWPMPGSFSGRKRSRRYPNRIAEVSGAPDAALVVRCGNEVRRLTSQLGQVRHIRRLATEQLAGRRYGLGGSGRIGHGRKRRRSAESVWTDGKWQRLADRVNDQLAFDVAAVTGKLGASVVVYTGGGADAALVTTGVEESTPHGFRGWQWHDLGTKIGAKIELEGARLERKDGYFAGDDGGKSKPRKKKRGKRWRRRANEGAVQRI